MTTKPENEVTFPSKAASYVAGSHAARVRTEHNERRTELLARDEILAGEIERREQERHDISEALALMSEPAPTSAASSLLSEAQADASVVRFTQPAAAE